MHQSNESINSMLHNNAYGNDYKDLDQSSSHQSDNRGTSSNEASSRAVSVDLGILSCRIARESVVASVDVDDERTSDSGSVRLSGVMSKCNHTLERATHDVHCVRNEAIHLTTSHILSWQFASAVRVGREGGLDTRGESAVHGSHVASDSLVNAD